MVEPRPTHIDVKDLSITYDGTPALSGVNLDIRKNEIFGIIGPAGSGKTSFLKVLNRMDAEVDNMSYNGTVLYNGVDVRNWRNLYSLRRKVGVVFPLPVGLPMSIYENVAFSPRIRGVRNKAELDVIVERCLTRAALWDEVKDRLDALGSLLLAGAVDAASPKVHEWVLVCVV